MSTLPLLTIHMAHVLGLLLMFLEHSSLLVALEMEALLLRFLSSSLDQLQFPHRPLLESVSILVLELFSSFSFSFPFDYCCNS